MRRQNTSSWSTNQKTQLKVKTNVSRQGDQFPIRPTHLGGAITLGDVGQHHLHVALGPKSARLHERLAVVDAAPVHVEAGVHIVQSVGDQVQRLEEPVVVYTLRLGPDPVDVCNGVEGRVHPPGSIRCDSALGFLCGGGREGGRAMFEPVRARGCTEGNGLLWAAACVHAYSITTPARHL